jgi:hypothetical protein
MKSLYLIAAFICSNVWAANDFQTGQFRCSIDNTWVGLWNVQTSEALSSLPYVVYTEQRTNPADNFSARGLASVETTSDTTIIGIKSLRDLDRYALSFHSDGTVTMGAVICTKQN